MPPAPEGERKMTRPLSVQLAAGASLRHDIRRSCSAGARKGVGEALLPRRLEGESHLLVCRVAQHGVS
jgi:hypothetical protein